MYLERRTSKYLSQYIFGFFVLVLVMSFGVTKAHASVTDGTIDVTDRYAWGENIGWVDFGSTTDAVHITDTNLTGSAYGENVGWIVLNPAGYGGVFNDTQGNLSGYAWGENIGWLDFSQVVIGSDGVFTGQAYSENVGWLTFGTTTNKVKTDWRPTVLPSVVPPTFIQEVETAFATTSLNTTPSFDVQAGDLLVAYAVSANSTGTPYLAISGGSLTWTKQESIALNLYSELAIWTATVDSDKSMTASFSFVNGVGASRYAGSVVTWRGSGGIGSAESTSTLSGAPSLNITTTKKNSAIVVVNADWNAIDGSVRTWRGNAGALTERNYEYQPVSVTFYGGYHANVVATGTYAVGLTATSGQKYSIGAIEVLGKEMFKISGILYEADRITPYATPTTIKIAVATSSIATSTPATFSTSTVATSGAFTFIINAGNVATSTPLTVFVDGNAVFKAVTVTKTSGTSTITNLALYKDHVTVKNEGGSGTTTKASDFVRYDSTRDSDIQFTASSTISRFTVASGQTLYVASSTTFHMDLPIEGYTFETATSATALASSTLTLTGHFIQNGVFAAGSGTTTFSGTSAQTLSGSLSGASKLNDVIFSGIGTKTITANASTSNLSINTTAITTFTNSLKVTNTFSASAGAKVALAGNATTTVGTLALNGTYGVPISFYSATSGQKNRFVLTGSSTVTYTNIADSNACGSTGGVIDVSSGSNINGGNNNCWSFVNTNPIISYSANFQAYTGQATTTLDTITITDAAGTPAIASTTDIRLTIATTTTNFRFNTSVTSLTFGGTASGKVSSTVSYADGGATLVVNVTSNFAASDTLTINGVAVGSFASISTTTSRLGLQIDGNATGTPIAETNETFRITGSLLVTDHTLGQVVNEFSYQNITDKAFFAFRLQAVGENATVTDLVFTLAGIQGVTAANITNFRLYKDNNADRILDGGDTQLDAAGILTINGQSGAITFSSDFLASSTVDYLVIGNTSDIERGDSLSFHLPAIGVTAVGATSLYSPYVISTVAKIQHERSGAGAGGSSARIGGQPPAGNGIVTGGAGGAGGGAGQEQDGQNIAFDPDFVKPTATGDIDNAWTNGSNALLSDGTYATASVANYKQSYNGFAFGIPPTNTIQGIAVKLDASSNVGATIDVSLSWDGGSSYTTAKATPNVVSNDIVYTVGGPADTWGRSSWSAAEFGPSLFRLRVTAKQVDGVDVKLDALEVRIYHQAGGGGSGGGGRI